MSSLWQDSLSSSTLTSVNVCDITALGDGADFENIIIGGGLTGVSTAFHLSRYGHRSLVLEAKSLASGASGRNGGILWPSASDPFEMAVTNEIQTLCQGTLDIQFKNGVHLYASQLDVDLLKTEKSFEAIIGSDSNTEEVINENVACISGAELVYAIAAASQPLATFVENAIVDSIECLCNNSDEKGSHKMYALHLKGGSVIFCNNIVIATNAWAPKLVPALSTVLFPCTNCVVSTSQPLNSQMTLPQLFGRPISAFSVGSGAHEIYGSITGDRRVVIGGLRSLSLGNAIGRDDTEINEADLITIERLKELFFTLFPEQEVTFDKSWIGVLTSTIDGLPILGEIHNASSHDVKISEDIVTTKNESDGLFHDKTDGCSRGRVYICAGYNGHGMPRCFGAARIVVKLMLCAKSQDRDHAEAEVLASDYESDVALTPLEAEVARRWSVSRFNLPSLFTSTL